MNGYRVTKADGTLVSRQIDAESEDEARQRAAKVNNVPADGLVVTQTAENPQRLGADSPTGK